MCVFWGGLPIFASVIEKRWDTAKQPTWNSKRLLFSRYNSMLISAKSIVYIKCCSPSRSRSTKNQSNTTATRSAFGWQDLKPCWQSKKVSFFEVINKQNIFKFFKRFVYHRRLKFVFHRSLLWTFQNTETADETFQLTVKQDFFRPILRSSAFTTRSQDQERLTNKGCLYPF